MKRLAAFVLLILPVLLYAQKDWDAIVIKENKVTDQIYFLEGSGGNIGLLMGTEGLLIVDDQYAELSEKIKSKLAELSGEELRFILNTHYHGDHTGGNENLSSDGAEIVAHKNVKERLSTTFYSTMFDRDVEAKSETYWPTQTFEEEMSMQFNNESIAIYHVPKGHTDGDALVFFVDNNVLHAGDLFVRYGFPFIDVSAGGSIQGVIDAQDKIIELSNSNTKIIPGHGQLASIEDVQELRQMLVETRDIVSEIKQGGKSLDECLSMNPLKDYHERWNGSFITTDLFVRFIYETVD